MFEDDDWNINEDDFNGDDIFNDNNDKTQNLFSTKNAETKKKTAVILNNSETKCNVADNYQNNVITQSSQSVSQKKVVLDIFKNSSDSQEVLRNNQEHSSNLGNEEPMECRSDETNECRKNLVLNVFQGGADKCKPIVKSVLKIPDHENKFKRKKNVAFLDSLGENNAMKRLRTEEVNKPSEAAKNDMDIDQENQTTSYEAGVYSKSDASNQKKRVLIDSLKTSVHKTTKAPRAKQAVVRKFPGPAGILPDDVSENDVIDIDSLDENKNNKSNQYADICSQNTKNLFTTGAWQLMMDDLPADFELYDIATIKENALQYSKTYRKVPYLAGIVQCIDYKPNDPHIILKDLSGKVDARIHHSICKLYPNALGTSIVILAKDVGLIVTSKKFVCVIISLNNLVSIYSDDVRLVETPHLKTLLKNDNTNHNLHESQISVLDETECHNDNEIYKNHSEEIQIGLQQPPKSILKSKRDVEKVKDTESIKDIAQSRAIRQDTNEHKKHTTMSEPETADPNCDVHDFEFGEDDSWLGVNIDELNSFKPHQFPSSTPMDSHDNNSIGTCFQIKNAKNVDSKGTRNFPDTGNIASVSSSKQQTSSNKKSISEKLSTFRNTNDTSWQPTIPKQVGLKENLSSNPNKPFEQEGNDTDDEMLSQLDVDAIAASYSTKNC